MTQKSYKLIVGSAAEAFHLSRAKIRLYGGGFANGKTTALVADAIRTARDYPGCTMMLGRATYPKLNSTLRREFFKWLPPSWIKSFNKTDNTCVLTNNTTIDFRYINQKVGSEGEQTSNLLSANYDYIGIDQIEDPEITEHDFEQMLGRLRGNTPYDGDDATMPRTGPRLMALACNPSLGWVYRRIVKPLHDFRAGRFNPDLICERNSQGEAISRDGRPIPIVEVFEASTYENAQNLEPDYIQTLEATYRGKMRDRYLLGKWVAFDGVIYDEFDENLHVIPHKFMMEHIKGLRASGYQLQLLEGYDLGLVQPSCYMQALTDANGITYIIAGFYEPNMGGAIDEQAKRIHALRKEHLGPEMIARNGEPEIFADPAIFRSSNAGRVMGETTASMFYANGIYMRRGNNDIMNGILKVKAQLLPRATVINPFTNAYGCPSVFVSDALPWFVDEITTWRWKHNRSDEALDQPTDGKDHAMDTLKYMMTKTPEPAKLFSKTRLVLPLSTRRWTESDVATNNVSAQRAYRYS